MAVDFNKELFVQGLSKTVTTIEDAAKFGEELANKIDRIYFVACGAPNRVMLGLQYWVEKYSSTLEIRRYYPAEFMEQNPAKMDERTLVLLGSKSGTTPETVAAAKFLKDKPCITVGVTQTEDLPLATAVQHAFLMGDTPQSHYGSFMIMQALISGILHGRSEWNLHSKLMASLKALPNALAESALSNDKRAAEDARIYKDDRILYQVASGPMFTTAYTFGVCYLMEMQWMHSTPLEAAEFFHGPFEIVDETMPFVLMMGEDPSRPLMERVERFCKKYTERIMTYDSKEFEMPGIDPEVRQIVAPYIIQVAIGRFTERLAVWHNQPLSTRRYMWKTEY